MSFADNNQAAAMDRMYRFQRHFYDLTRRYYLLGRDELVENLRVPPGGTVLEVGCGTGRNLVKVAEAYPDARIYGFDISAEMLKSASEAVMRAPEPRRIQLAQADAVTFDPRKVFGVAGFDRIFFSYTLSMVPPWEAALLRARSLLSPEGELHVADFGQCERLPQAGRSLLFAWLRLFGVTPRKRLPDVFRDMCAAGDARYSMASSFGGYSWHLVLRKPD